MFLIPGVEDVLQALEARKVDIGRCSRMKMMAALYE